MHSWAAWWCEIRFIPVNDVWGIRMCPTRTWTCDDFCKSRTFWNSWFRSQPNSHRSKPCPRFVEPFAIRSDGCHQKGSVSDVVPIWQQFYSVLPRSSSDSSGSLERESVYRWFSDSFSVVKQCFSYVGGPDWHSAGCCPFLPIRNHHVPQSDGKEAVSSWLLWADQTCLEPHDSVSISCRLIWVQGFANHVSWSCMYRSPVRRLQPGPRTVDRPTRSETAV